MFLCQNNNTDASDDGIIAILNILREKENFQSHVIETTPGAEANYSVTELETYAITSSIEYFILVIVGKTI